MKTSVRLECLRTAVLQLLASVGVPDEDQTIIADSIEYAHRVGRGTHGLGRMSLYLTKIEAGLMNPVTAGKLVSDGPVVSVMDAEDGFGQVAATRAMALSIEKAEHFGVGICSVRNSNNFGTAGFIAEQATKRNMIGIVLGNSGPAIAPTGGHQAILGTNPLGLSFPNPKGDYPISLDMATSQAARGKIRQAAKDGLKIPLGWAIDSSGQPTDDPLKALKGSMVPIGQHKGYGLSLAIDILAGLLSGAGFAGDVKPLGDMESVSNYGHFCMAIDVSHFMTLDEWADNIDYLIARIKSAGYAGQVHIPGENTHRSFRRHNESIEVENTVLESIGAMLFSRSLPCCWDFQAG